MNIPFPRIVKRIHSRLRRGAAANVRGPALSDLFDVDWYRTQRPDLEGLANPIAHYLSEGAAQGLNPNPLFHSDWYLEHNPDVKAAGMNPLMHYVGSGAQEGRNPSAYFDSAWYARQYPAARLTHADALSHFMKTGYQHGFKPNPYFDTFWYLNTYPEVAAYPHDPLSHFVLIGEPAGYQPGPQFDPKWYLIRNPDVANWPGTPFTHYLLTGARENRPAERGPHNFENAAALARQLAAPAVSQDTIRATLNLSLGSISELADLSDGAHRIYQAQSRSVQGYSDKPAAYPGLPYVARLDGVMALGGTRYIVAHNRICHDEAAAFQHVKDAAVKYHRAQVEPDGKAMLNFQLKPANWLPSGIDIMHEYSNNYFHFVAETLPRIILAEEAGVPNDVPFLVESDLHANMRQLLEMVNASQRPVLQVESDTMYRVDTLYYPSDVTSVVDSYEAGEAGRLSCLDVARISAAVAHCKESVPTPSVSRKRKIYAGRGGRIRCLTNQQDLEAALAARGFEIIRTDGLDIRTQIAIFRDAEVIVAPTGAQLTNMVWCEPGTQVIVLASDHPSHQLYLWELLGRVSQARVSFAIGPRAYTRDDKYSVHDDYSVDVQKILDQI